MTNTQSTQIAIKNLDNQSLEIQLEAIKELKILGTQEAIDAIESKLINDHFTSTKFQTEALETLRELNARDSIENVLKSGVGLAVKTLSNIGDNKAVETIAKEINGGDRNLAVLALAKIGSDLAIKILAETVLNEHSFIAIPALTASINLGEKKAVPLIGLALKHQDKKVRLAALERLKWIGNKKALEVIESAKADVDNEIINYAENILKNKNLVPSNLKEKVNQYFIKLWLDNMTW